MNTNTYEDFLDKKRIFDVSSGHEPKRKINDRLFPFQADIVRWTLRRGRAAVFADCGLGKTPIQLEWAAHVHKQTQKPILILAPLAVAEQTKEEGVKFGIPVTVCREQSDVVSGINITNYEKLHHFDPSIFSGVVIDESSILKNFDGKFRTLIIDSFKETPYRLACTATPAPNDWMELGNHAEFLGVMTRSEMLSMFFVNDTKNTGTWRLKKHIQNNEFWHWLSSWAVMVSSPSDLGYANNQFQLPQLNYFEHKIISDIENTYGFFPKKVSGLLDRKKIRKNTVEKRCHFIAEIVKQKKGNWVLWCGLNAESKILKELIPNAVEVTGSQTNEEKRDAMLKFAHSGGIMITKPKIAGRGMNWQIAHQMAFVGLNDSWEELYQAVRRLWRFGQTKNVEVHIVIEEREESVLENIKRKDTQARIMIETMIKQTKNILKAEIGSLIKETTEYTPNEMMRLPRWIL